MLRVDDILEGQKGDQGEGPKLAKKSIWGKTRTSLRGRPKKRPKLSVV